jgi:hypothetical protein
MATDFDAYMNISSNANDTFLNASNNDMLIFTQTSNQRILLGTLQGTNAAISVSSNQVDLYKNLNVNANISVNGTFTQNGQPIGTQFTNNNANIYIINSNVGLGLSNPLSQLHVSGDISLYNGTNTIDAGGSLNFGIASSNAYSAMSQIKGLLINSTTTELQGGIGFLTRVSGAAGQALTEKMRIQNNGFVGIGLSNPTNTLHVQTNIASSAIIISGSNSTGINSFISFSNYGANGNNNVTIGLKNFSGDNALQFYNSSTSSGTLYSFLNNNASTSLLNILANGNIGVGKTPAYTLDVSGSICANFVPNNGFLGYAGAVHISSITRLNNDTALSSWGNLYFYTNSTSAPATGQLSMYIGTNGFVGLGTTSPAFILDMYSTDANSNMYTRIRSDYSRESGLILDRGGTATWNITNLGTGNAARSNNLSIIYNTLPFVEISKTGNVGINNTAPTFKLDVAGNIRANYSGYGNGILQMNFGPDDTICRTAMQTYANASFMPMMTGTSVYQYLSSGTTAYRIITTASTFFTGQHAGYPTDSNIKLNIADYIGLIVSSTGDGYISYNTSTGEKITGIDAIQINESLPIIKLSAIDNDKAVFGVLSDRKDNASTNTDGTTETDSNPLFGTGLYDRVRINSIGEGAIWISNINGNIDNGDYITSSIIPGMGKKQNDDILHNYTVAKSTMPCSFQLNNSNYNCVEFTFKNAIYRKAFIGCTYHCG